MALRVLLADESTTIKKVIQLSLKDFAVEVKSVANGLDVISVAKSFAPDIAFVDVLLPKKSGYEVCQELKADAELSHLPVVLMWSGFMEIDEKKATDANADRRLEKPFDIETLRDLVKALVPKTESNPVNSFLQFPQLPDFTEAGVAQNTPAPKIPASAPTAAQKMPPKPPPPQTSVTNSSGTTGGSPQAASSYSAPPPPPQFESSIAVDRSARTPSNKESELGSGTNAGADWLSNTSPESFEALSIQGRSGANINRNNQTLDSSGESFHALNLEDISNDFHPSEHEEEEIDFGSYKVKDEGQFAEISFGDEDSANNEDYNRSTTQGQNQLNSNQFQETSTNRLKQRDASSVESELPSMDPEIAIRNALSELIQSEEVQSSLQENLQKSAENVCWQLLPEILERVVREEIAKILDEVDEEFHVKS